MRIGVDVGGTNTDAVLLSEKGIIASVKRATSDDISSGITESISSLLSDSKVSPESVTSVMIGTTHLTNAFVQRRDLVPVHVIRLGYPASRGIPPFSSWPADLKDIVCGGSAILSGGFEFDGREIGSLDEPAIVESVEEAHKAGIEQVAISCIFSQLNSKHENRAAELIAEVAPEMRVSLSCEVGRVGLLERENAAIMNASLRPLAAKITDAFAHALQNLEISAPFFISQNDGTLMSAEHMQRYPVLTFAAGPTNSLRGAAWLTGAKDAIVVDIGGTTSDVGVLISGFPRQSTVHVDVGGVRTNFRMPDVLSIGLGGGSCVRETKDGVTVGPDSVGFRLATEGIVFGGATLTASDIAVAVGNAEFGNPDLATDLAPDLISNAQREISVLLEDAIDRMKTAARDVPMILVGGGAVLVSKAPSGVSKMLVPEYAGVANAVGAAIGQVSGEIDRIYTITDTNSRQEALASAEAEAKARAIEAGADKSTLEIVNIEVAPLQYLPGGATRVVCRAVGDLMVGR